LVIAGSVGAALLVLLHHDLPFQRLGSDLCRPLMKGRCFTCNCGARIVITEATKILQIQDRNKKNSRSVTVFGKPVRRHSDDPAPLSMFETVVTLKPSVNAARMTGTAARRSECQHENPGMANILWMRSDAYGNAYTGSAAFSRESVRPDLGEIQKLARQIENNG